MCIESIDVNYRPKSICSVLIGNMNTVNTPLILEPVHILICIRNIYCNPAKFLACLDLSKLKSIFK